MLLVKSITRKKINVLSYGRYVLTILLLAYFLPAFSQDNSPYSRYGLGDIVPNTNISSRAMGGISAAVDPYGLTINYNNPASYSRFMVDKEPKSKSRIKAGRAVLDVGINLDNRTLREPNNPNKFGTSNLLFSHLQVGMPVSQKLGISFGLRPLTRISYRIGRYERLFDPIFGTNIDSAYTEYEGEGGLYLVAAGAGYKIIDKPETFLSIGFNAGYMFGEKDYSTRRVLINDSVEYYKANYETKTSLGNYYIDAGFQFRKQLNKDKHTYLSIGAFGNLKNILEANQDRIQETYIADPTLGNIQLDSVSIQRLIHGESVYPANYTIGFTLERFAEFNKHGGWLVGVDFVQNKWDEYRFYGQKDSVQNKWELRLGGEIRPKGGKNYFSNVTYRVGMVYGTDYIKVKEEIPQYGLTFGMALPLENQGRRYGSFNQATVINLAFEFLKRGNNDNLLRENMFRVSLGLSLSDFWFIKRKYE
jgi:hypothetical protein